MDNSGIVAAGKRVICPRMGPEYPDMLNKRLWVTVMGFGSWSTRDYVNDWR